MNTTDTNTDDKYSYSSKLTVLTFLQEAMPDFYNNTFDSDPKTSAYLADDEFIDRTLMEVRKISNLIAARANAENPKHLLAKLGAFTRRAAQNEDLPMWLRKTYEWANKRVTAYFTICAGRMLDGLASSTNHDGLQSLALTTAQFWREETLAVLRDMNQGGQGRSSVITANIDAGVGKAETLYALEERAMRAIDMAAKSAKDAGMDEETQEAAGCTCPACIMGAAIDPAHYKTQNIPFDQTPYGKMVLEQQRNGSSDMLAALLKSLQEAAGEQPDQAGAAPTPPNKMH